MEIKAEVKSISKLSDYFFVVPDYQREYVWKPDDQVEQFIIDIDNEFDPAAKEQSGYFIGSIILVENKGKFDVIDGQQRLTTIVLALCACRDVLSSQELNTKQKEYLSSITSLLSKFDMNTDETQLRLELQYEESKDYLKKLIATEKFEEKKTPSIEKMEKAYKRLSDYFGNHLQQGVEDLTKFVRYFLTKIELVIIESENLSSALKIFETINQRGAGLNAMDLVKNLLFSEAREGDFQKIKDTWKEITANLQACNEDSNPLRFLRYFLMARYYNGILREDDIYKWIISPDGKRLINFEQEPLRFAKELKGISERYSKLVIATEKVYEETTDHPHVTNIGFINKYKSRQHLILLLALPQSVSIEVIEYLAKQIESFFFFSNTIGIQAKNNERLFSSWSKALRDTNTTEEVAEALEKSIIPYLAERVSQFKSEFLNISHNSYNPQYRLRHILGRMENTSLEYAGLPTKGFNTIHGMQIEHILPQTPLNGFIPEEFEDQDEYFTAVYKLGNVTLLESTINQAVNNFNNLRNDWFQRKQTEYSNSTILSTNLLNDKFAVGKQTKVNLLRAELNCSFNLWSKAQVQERQKILMELAFRTWRINGKRLDTISSET